MGDGKSKVIRFKGVVTLLVNGSLALPRFYVL